MSSSPDAGLLPLAGEVDALVEVVGLDGALLLAEEPLRAADRRQVLVVAGVLRGADAPVGVRAVGQVERQGDAVAVSGEVGIHWN